VIREVESLGGKPASQKFSHRSRAARHALLEPPILHGLQFLSREHDLQTLKPVQIRHGCSSDIE
jgi:hypothetical protein